MSFDLQKKLQSERVDVVSPSTRRPVSVNRPGRTWIVNVAVANLYIMTRVSAGRSRKLSVLAGAGEVIAAISNAWRCHA